MFEKFKRYRLLRYSKKKNWVKPLCKILTFVLLATSLFCFVACSGKTDLEKVAKDKSQYVMDITYNSTEQTLAVEEVVKYVNNETVALKNLNMHLYANAFRSGAIYKPITSLYTDKAYPNGFSEGNMDIKSVQVNNKDSEFEITGEDKNILNVVFKISLQPTAMHEIKIKFTVKIPNCNHRLGYGDGFVNLGNFYPIACVYENGKFVTDTYSSNGDPFYSDIASYSVTLKQPVSFNVASTGNITKETVNNQTKTTKISAVSVRDFAMVLSNKMQVKESVVDGVKISYHYLQDAQADTSLKCAEDSVRTYNELFGQYPYKQLSVVQTGFCFGGMEYPNLVYISQSVEDYESYINVIAHEIAHQWWYGVVGNNEYKYGWLDEGLTEFSTILFYENNPSYNISAEKILENTNKNYRTFLRVYTEVFNKVDTTMNRSLNEYATETEYVYTAYVKGVLLHESLRNLLGEKKYIKCLKAYFSECGFKNNTPEQLIDSFENSSKKDLKSFFNAWINGEVVFES